MSNENLMNLTLQVSLDSNDNEQLDQLTRLLRNEIKELGVETVDLITSDLAPKGAKPIDPVVIGALVVALGPTMVTKFLEFLHAWAMRREGRLIKIKVQTGDTPSLEIEVPQTMSPDEVKNWINLTRDSLVESQQEKKG